MEFEKEIWKNVKEFNGLYEVSSNGRMKSYKRYKEGKILKLSKYSNGYLFVKLSPMNTHRGEYKKAYSVHRLVAETFIPNPNNYPCVNHKDGNKQNNNVDNLEWCTYSYNTKHAYKNNLKRTIHINQYELNGDFIKQWSSIKEASNTLNISYVGIVQCCRHRSKSSGNYIWRYAKK